MKAILVAILLFINMVITAISILIFYGIFLLIPKPWRRPAQAWLQKVPVWWMDINYWILKISIRDKWQIEGHEQLDPNQSYLLVCNHQSWFDILVLGIFFRHQTPNLKFFMKKELLWSLPVAGLACYVLGYPFMARHSHEEIKKNPHLKNQDIETTREACQKFKEFPTTVMIFVEGTRFSTKKRDAQHSPYRYLLKPKATGMALVLQELHHELSGILNVTLHYSPQDLSLWEFLQGKINKIYLRYELLPITANLVGDPYQDRVFRKEFQNWLNQIWKSKDSELENMSK